MRFAAIADIHGNFQALQAVLAGISALGIDDIVNLGDCFSGPLEADRVGDVLLERDMVTVRGNHDRYLIDRDVSDMEVSDSFAFRQMSARHLEWLRGLPSRLVYRDEAYLCHATPRDDNHYWLEQVSPDGTVSLKPLEAIEGLAKGIEHGLILCAHSHIPRMVRLGDGRLIVNPGSVGCPAYDDDAPYPHKVEAGHPMASYAILDKSGADWTATFRTVAYDHMAASDLAARNGREDWASGLATGWLR